MGEGGITIADEGGGGEVVVEAVVAEGEEASLPMMTCSMSCHI